MREEIAIGVLSLILLAAPAAPAALRTVRQATDAAPQVAPVRLLQCALTEALQAATRVSVHVP